VANLVDLVSRHHLDGIDVDIEGNHVSASTYDPFIAKLRAALPQDTLITVAVATWNGDDFPDAALATFDFINLMSYDHCGSWTAEPCDHSSYADSLDELSYWENDRGIPADKMVLGVPFYGYCWGASCPNSALTHAEIVASYPEGADSDYFSGSGYTISHNTPSTIGQKADLAKMHGGIMIWEIGQDGSGEDSLLQVVADHQ
jgi:GH18 family chitinase